MSEFTDAIRQALGERVSVLEAENRRLHEAALAHPPIGTRYRDESGVVVAVMVPASITAETGHKAALMGELFEIVAEPCSECEGAGFFDGEDCEFCDGRGEFDRNVGIGWDNIKTIHRAMLAALPDPD